MDQSLSILPQNFAAWFAGRGWQLRTHQAELLEKARAGRSALLIAPTGGGKTLAGFLPSLIDVSENPSPVPHLHTLYISPLKALAVDVSRNLQTPAEEMGLSVRIETRTGDTPAARRQRQRHTPPDILLTTPEQLALLLAHPSAAEFFARLNCVILDELHALVTSKRGDLLALGLARLWQLAPKMRTVGLSATVAEVDPLRRWLVSQHGRKKRADLVTGQGGAEPNITILETAERIPWQGHLARHAYKEVYDAIKTAQTSLIFTNTRSQAEIIFAALWQLNEDNLPIALHHGSLDVGQRRKVEAAMAGGALRAVVCTSTLDLGIDWGEVDLVIQIGAPKGSSRLIQRIGRSNHRFNEVSRALLVPANRFEVLECQAACEAVRENVLDGDPPREGALDVLAQHVWGMAAAEPFHPDDLYKEVTSAWAYSKLSREDFNQVLDFVATGGYALKAYERYRRIVPAGDGRMKIRDARTAQQYRMNVGTIIEAQSVTLRLGSIRKGKDGKPFSQVRRLGRKLGSVEEWFIDHLGPKDTFLFGGEVLRFEGMLDGEAFVTRASSKEASVPSWQGGKFPLTTYLASRVRQMIDTPSSWQELPEQVRDWLELQRLKSVIPKPKELLIETFARKDRHFLVCYPFDGRLAHQSLGMLLTRRLERAGVQPLGFCPTEYALSVWTRKDMEEVDMRALFDEDMLGDDLETWLADAALMKHTFRNCAIIAGLIERNHIGERKTGRQVTFSADLIYDVLRAHEPDHILLKAAWTDAAGGFLDIARLSALLARVQGRLNHIHLPMVSPLAVPVMMEVNREAIHGSASEAILEELQAELLAEATA
ncbi:ligase-associated DNA damage response DEXH box helicase [Parvularcula sp. IMCC14364]|uniref:ligase-associated DNA damage response DEXH box helicase n=1 Tax=Parvularcula sp. IMCC14364 TaxID=3067902 RepID=UPI0027415A50|nr:ligase-associated DNA damage response DEXH box helicase [Parvularcula sp. IMCC14364]